MGFGFFTSCFFFTLFFKITVSQEPNTDGFFVSDFLKKMGLVSSESHNFSDSVCSWQGVFCDTQQEHVIRLVGSDLGLSGVIPENTIGKLTNLQHLDLSNNSITGFSSDFWGLGGSLQSLNFSCNKIYGPLPSSIGNFGLLQTVDLSCNDFSGEIPLTIGSLSVLRVLKLSKNRFGGTIPSELVNCQSLILIDFSSNRLNGTVPDGFGTAFVNLSALNFADNEFRGRISDFEGLNSIHYLNLSSNLFQGPVLGVFQRPLEIIDLSKNQFQGHISQIHFNSSFNWSSLVHLDVSENQLSGEIIRDLNEARSLKHLNLAYNRFTIQRFPRTNLLSGLEYLNLSQTGLVDQIPADISQLISLTTLDLSENNLSGPVPDLSSTDLQVLDLSQNNLTGEIPSALLQKLPDMVKFNFSDNNLTLCASKFSRETLRSAFFGSKDNCPIAANPDLFRRKDTNHKGLKLGLAITLSLFCFVVGMICLVFSCRKKTRMWAAKQLSYKEEPNISGPFAFQTDSTTWVADVKLATSVPVIIFEKPLLNFTFADLLSATSHFDRGTLLAEGRFGPVYRCFLPGGIHVAVKVLVNGSTITEQDAARALENLGRIKHPNLVLLKGYCIAGDQRIAIYDYMEYGNLHNLLHDLPLGIETTEDWSTDTWEEDNVEVRNTAGITTWKFRHKIALGTARALAFLHHGCSPPIIHRDVKASSIYLDSAMQPRLSDFGLAKIVTGTNLEDEISRGTPGYVPPELSERETMSVTSKTDVYGFGVTLLELITGKKPIGDDYLEERESNLVNWVRGLVRKNEGSMAIDPKIRGTGLEMQMVEGLRIGYLCTADLPAKRPSMQQVVGLLKDIGPVLD